MKELWKKYTTQLDAMSLRARLMVFGAILLGILYVLFTLYIEPAQKREKQLTLQMQQQSVELKTVQQQVQALQERVADPDRGARVRRDALQTQIAGIDENLKSMQKSLVPAQRMNALLQDMLSRNPRLGLVDMRTLPLATLVQKRADASDKAGVGSQLSGEGNVYKHGVEITLAGSYADLHDYLARLEKLPWRMFWSRATLAAAEYPRVTLKVTIYTLSLDKAWLQL